MYIFLRIYFLCVNKRFLLLLLALKPTPMPYFLRHGALIIVPSFIYFQ